MKDSHFKCPTLIDLPLPPVGRSGWPWDEETSLPESDPKAWPTISLIIPSFNHGQYIEETIRSILLQGYPRLELHVIDGGSSDNTVEIIRKYESWLNSWVSEKDSGQSEAINKGFHRCSGEIFNWLCSDDLLTPGSLRTIAGIFVANPRICVVSGASILQYEGMRQKDQVVFAGRDNWPVAPYSAAIWQPSTFFRRDLIQREKLVEENLHFCMDRELWTYLCLQSGQWEWLDQPLSIYRVTGENKSAVGGTKIIDELERVYVSYEAEVIPLPILIRKLWLPMVLVNARHSSSFVRIVSLLCSRAVAATLLTFYPKVKVRALQREFLSYSLQTV